MPKKTPAQKRAQKAYIEKFARVEIRVTTEKQVKIKPTKKMKKTPV